MLQFVWIPSKEVSLALYQNNEVDALLARIERIYQEVDDETQDYLMRLHAESQKIWKL